MRQAELEHKIRGSYTGIKESLRPANIAKNTLGTIFSSVSNITLNKGGIIKGAIALGIGILAKKLTQKAGDKIKKVFTK